MDEQLRDLERRFVESGLEEDRRAWQRARARAGLVTRVGLVFLDDLHSFGSWISDRTPAWRAERDLDGPLLPPTVHPPPAVVAVATTQESVAVSAEWLRLASAVVVVAVGDALLAKDTIGDSLEWIATAPQGVEAAIDRALDRALSAGRAEWTWLCEGTRGSLPEVPRGPWIPFTGPVGYRSLASLLCAPHGHPAMLDPRMGDRIDLLTGARTPVRGLLIADEYRPVAAAPLGTGWFWAPAGPRNGYLWGEEDRPPRTTQGGFGQAIGFEHRAQIAWAGGRCHFHWRVPTASGLVYWTPSNHDWPCGHAKKLYGYEDNDPVWVHLSPDAQACLSVYEHDVLLTPGLPLRWRDVGRFALAERARGEPRALFFQRGTDPDQFPGDPFQADEDARDRRATVTLGPSSDARYVVGLDAPTYRLANETVTLLGGPADEWVVYDDTHQERQRHPGRLLAGWDRWVVVLRAGQLQRVDLVSGEAEDLGPPGNPVTEALAVPGTRSVVLVSQVVEGVYFLRAV